MISPLDLPPIVFGVLSVAGGIGFLLALEQACRAVLSARGNVRKPRKACPPTMPEPEIYQARDGTRLYTWGSGVRWPTVTEERQNQD